jgi:hypothetical protein
MTGAMLKISLAVALATAAVVATTASAGLDPRVTASPNPVQEREQLTIRGRGWPVIEFCERRVKLSLRSDQNRVRLGTARVRRSGRFRKRLTPRSVNAGPGDWRLVAVLPCESGKDGSPNPIRRRTNLTIR